jgi:hypothetical protein
MVMDSHAIARNQTRTGRVNYDPDAIHEWLGTKPPKRPTIAPVLLPINGHKPNIDHPLVRTALQKRLDELARMGANTGRNAELNKAAAYLGRFPIPRPQLRDMLIDACRANGVLTEDGQRQCDATITSGFAKADKDGPRTLDEINHLVIEVDPHELHPESHPKSQLESHPKPQLESLEQNFWTARQSLQLIHQAALSRMASPWAVLACCAARILSLVPPAITLPAIIGGPGSLNWFAAISAKSGGGKGAAMAVAAKLVDAEIIVRGIGSGEGMIEAYRRSAKEEEDYVESVLFSIDEIDSLGAMGGRSGQTTMAILRQGFSGEKLGYSYRGRQSETVPAHTYRMAIVASVQPERAGVLFDDAGGGTPQRFMWFPGRDKRITAQPPEWPANHGRERVLPLIARMDLGTGTITVPPIVPQTIRHARAASMSGDDNALDSHALYCREKFAYALSYMDGRTEIDEDDWELSGIAATVSDWCRTKARDGYEAAKLRQSRERGSLRAVENDERDIVSQQTYSAHIQRIVTTIMKILRDNGPMTHGALNRKLAYRDRPRIGAALTSAVEHKLLTEIDGKWTLK